MELFVFKVAASSRVLQSAKADCLTGLESVIHLDIIDTKCVKSDDTPSFMLEIPYVSYETFLDV